MTFNSLRTSRRQRVEDRVSCVVVATGPEASELETLIISGHHDGSLRFFRMQPLDRTQSLGSSTAAEGLEGKIAPGVHSGDDVSGNHFPFRTVLEHGFSIAAHMELVSRGHMNESSATELPRVRRGNAERAAEVDRKTEGVTSEDGAKKFQPGGKIRGTVPKDRPYIT